LVRQQYSEYPDVGPSSLLLSTEEDPDKTVLEARVAPGSYYVELLDNWQIEKLSIDGTYEPVDAVLISASTHYVWVYGDSTRWIKFRFGVGGEAIDFIGGNIRIGVEIEEYDAGVDDAN
jgi:hypothetical protein